MLKYYLYAIVPAFLLLSTFIWVVVSLIRRSKFWRIAAGIFAVEILVLVIGYFVYFTPVEYPRNYLNDPVPEPGSLAKIAKDWLGQHIHSPAEAKSASQVESSSAMVQHLPTAMLPGLS